jgi:hypothetical protein
MHALTHVTNILCAGDNAATNVTFHIDTVEYKGKKDVIRVIMFMNQTRNLHIFHMADLLQTPEHRVIPMPNVHLNVLRWYLLVSLCTACRLSDRPHACSSCR